MQVGFHSVKHFLEPCSLGLPTFTDIQTSFSLNLFSWELLQTGEAKQLELFYILKLNALGTRLGISC